MLTDIPIVEEFWRRFWCLGGRFIQDCRIQQKSWIKSSESTYNYNHSIIWFAPVIGFLLGLNVEWYAMISYSAHVDIITYPNRWSSVSHEYTLGTTWEYLSMNRKLQTSIPRFRLTKALDLTPAIFMIYQRKGSTSWPKANINNVPSPWCDDSLIFSHSTDILQASHQAKEKSDHVSPHSLFFPFVHDWSSIMVGV